jgi:formylglycine-generating enzyme
MKTKNALCGISIAVVLQLGVLAVVHPVLAQPALGIVPTNNQVILFWPSSTHGTNGVLQSATNLVSPNWLSATDAFPVNYGSQIAVSVTNVSSARFFRLSLVPPTADGMAFIPADSFTIGDTLDGESDAIPTNVYVSAFYMDVNLVTSNQWAGVYSYATSHGYSFDNAGEGKAANNPVQLVAWYDCVKWCNARSAQAGLAPVYYTDAGLTQVYTNGDVDITNTNVNWTANGYRLPTEAEWEKAARGGLSGQRFPWGDTISESQANYVGDTNISYDLGPNGYNANFDSGGFPYTSPVGSFAPNGYGLNDMAGNVFEWCWDWYAVPTYPTGSPYLGGIDPRGPTSSPYGDRVLRGGDWAVSGASYARCANRYGFNPDGAGNNAGFRCVRGLPNTPTAPGFTVGGTLTGLRAGDTVTLQDNGSDNLTLSNNATFTFPTALPNGQSYSVTVSALTGLTPPQCTLMNGSGTISGANVTNVAVQCTRCPAFTGDRDLDMYNAAVSDGTAHGGVPGVMSTVNGGPVRVTARGWCSDNVAVAYSGWAVVTQVVGSNSCSSTTFPSGTTVIQFGGALVCGQTFGPYQY